MIQRTRKEKYIKYGLDEEKCLIECIIYPKCDSINIHILTGTCVVNYNVDEASKEVNIVTDIGWMYYEKEKLFQFHHPGGNTILHHNYSHSLFRKSHLGNFKH